MRELQNAIDITQAPNTQKTGIPFNDLTQTFNTQKTDIPSNDFAEAVINLQNKHLLSNTAIQYALSFLDRKNVNCLDPFYSQLLRSTSELHSLHLKNKITVCVPLN